MRKLILWVGVAVAGFVIPHDARAESLSFEGMGKSSIVTLAGVRPGVFYAGELNWSWLGTPPDGLTPSFYTYCVDLLSEVINPQNVTVRSTTEFTSGTVSDAGAKAAWLFNTVAPLIRASGTDVQAAALQVALWEAIYDPVLDLGAGSFRLVTDAGVYGGQQTALAIFAQASEYLTGLKSDSYIGSSAMWLYSEEGQDQIASVPEPAILLLLGFGLLAVAGFARARRPVVRAVATHP